MVQIIAVGIPPPGTKPERNAPAATPTTVPAAAPAPVTTTSTVPAATTISREGGADTNQHRSKSRNYDGTDNSHTDLHQRPIPDDTSHASQALLPINALRRPLGAATSVLQRHEYATRDAWVCEIPYSFGRCGTYTLPVSKAICRPQDERRCCVLRIRFFLIGCS